MMTVILTAPERLAIMMLDADERTRATFDTFPNDVDNIMRPAWYVGAGDGTYPPGAAGAETPLENFALEFIGVPFGSGGMTNRDAEMEAREIVANTILYFMRREQLQFSNVRSLKEGQMSALQNVKWARVTGRTPVGVVTRAGIEGDHWGCTLTMSIQSAFAFEQALVANV